MEYWVNENEVQTYQPAGHEDTYNRRLLERKSDGLRNIEVVLGEMGPRGHAAPHAHQEIEQAMYIIDGHLRVRIGEKEAILSAGSAIAIPSGLMHEVWSASEHVKFLIVYSPVKKLIKKDSGGVGIETA